jgi:(p)ppGpp synthase/HD superfamily hydrolase
MDLERAIEIAASAHRGQVDKADKPYILHPLRVMLACTDVTAQIVAVLHDVIEDTTGHPGLCAQKALTMQPLQRWTR